MRVLYEFYMHNLDFCPFKPWVIFDLSGRLLCDNYHVKVDNDTGGGLDLLDASPVHDYADMGTYCKVIVDYDSDD